MVAYIWEFGPVGLVSSRLIHLRANNKLVTQLALGLTVPLSTRSSECKIPDQLEAIIPGMHKSYFVPAAPVPEIHSWRFFDPIHHYAWGLQGVMRPVLAGGTHFQFGGVKKFDHLARALCNMITEQGATIGEAVFFLDILEVKGHGKICAQEKNNTWHEFAQVLEFFRRKQAPKLFGMLSKTSTPGMSKFGVSSRALPPYLGCWKRLYTVDGETIRKKKAEHFFKDLVISGEKAAQKQLVTSFRERLHAEGDTIVKALDRVFDSSKQL